MQSNQIKELTFFSIFFGILIGVVMTAANVYLGLYAGMTVSASIPAAVMAMGVMQGIFKRQSVLESNIVQTMASAGESLAAGIIFTLPALVIVGAWESFNFIQTTGIAIAGGLLGVIFMVPLRKALIIEDKNLTYPEGVACGAVLNASSDGDSGPGMGLILKGLGLGALFKFCSSGLGVLKGSVEWAFAAGSRSMFFGFDASPALLSVGYIVGLHVAVLVFIGGAVGWFIGIPLLGIPENMKDASMLDVAWTLWSTQIRYLGVGAMIVGGLWSIFSVRKGMASGLKGMQEAYKQKGNLNQAREDQDLPLGVMLGIFVVCLLIMLALYKSLIGSLGITIMTTIIMFMASFLFVAVSSYIVGLVGSSNNPVSGMTISALLGTAIFFLVLGFQGENAILATLGVAAVVCCAACTAGDCSQDLKTGSIVGATPKKQQIAQIIGVVVPAVVIAPVLSLLHEAYGIGTGLKAPQATLFASITKALFGNGELPYHMVGIGAVLGVVILIADKMLEKKGAKFRLHLMPLAVGIYLPVTLAIPMLIGGLIRHKLSNPKLPESKDPGILMSSGLIAGEALMGVMVALILYFKVDIKVKGLSSTASEFITIAAFLFVTMILIKLVKAKKS